MKSHIEKLKSVESKRTEKNDLTKKISKGLDHDYLMTFSSPSGIRVLNDLIAMTHLFQTSFSFTGSNQSDFREGERNIGLKITKKMSHIDQSILFKAFKINLKQEYVKK